MADTSGTLLEQARAAYDAIDEAGGTGHPAEAEELFESWLSVQFAPGTTQTRGLKALAVSAGASASEAGTQKKALRELILRAAPAFRPPCLRSLGYAGLHLPLCLVGAAMHVNP